MHKYTIGQLSAKENNGSEDVDTDADKYFEPLRAACESRVAKVMEIALDAIHILIERGYLRGSKKVYLTPKAGEKAAPEGDEDVKQQKLTLMDLIIDTVSKCSDEFDDSVQLQVINSLLTAVTSPYCEVHEASLLLAVRACFHIHLITRNTVNKQTAKGALTQMLSAIFRRMEMMESSNRNFRETGAVGSALGGMDVVNSSSNGELLPYTHCMYAEVYDSLGFRSAVGKAYNEADASMKELNSSAVAEAVAGGVVTDIAESAGKSEASNLSFSSIHHKDAFLLFRALCKLSMKGLHDDSGTQNDPIALQNKLLSLDLVLHILQQSGPAFKTGDKFIYAIRNYLCVSLLGNCTSQVAEVTGLGLHIFVLLMGNFKDHLKNELEIFISSIFLRILESEYSTYDHKMKVLEVFHKIVQDPAGQIEIFVNYDCDFEANDMFRRIVDAFAKISKNPNLPQSRAGTDFLTSSVKKTQQEEKNVKAMGLEGLVIILRSLLKSSGLGLAPTMKDVLANNSSVTNMLIISGANAYAKPKSPMKKQPSMNSASGAGFASNDAADDIDDITLTMKLEEKEDTTADVDNPVANYDRKQKIMEEIDSGILKFNLSAKRGIQFMVSKGHIEYTPKDVANFFHVYKDRLDKSQVGEYLGKEREYEKGFPLQVLHEYVDQMDFQKISFSEAIRLFLSGFRIPGEAQKIDRIMEKFAERYYIQNRDIFASADMAFILAFSTIMLQTNLHNPSIKDDKRMTKEQFLKQNKGISTDGELPEELLVEIYDNIAAKPISITTDDASAGPNNKKGKKEDANIPFTVFSNDKRRKDAFHNERREMVKAGEMMIKQSRKKVRQGSVYVRSSSQINTEITEANLYNGGGQIALGVGGGDEVYVKPMFDVSWAPMLGVFSQVLETSDDEDLISQCLTGFLYAIRLSARTPEFATARQSFINALARFTTLETVKEMRTKNVECIRALIYVALVDAEYLDESWFQILQCVSQLARLILIGNGLADDREFMATESPNTTLANPNTFFSFSNNTPPAITTNSAGARRGSIIAKKESNAGSNAGAASGAYDPFKAMFGGGPTKAETARNVEESNALLIASENIDDKLIDRIIVHTQYLSSDSVCHFIDSLCKVSKYEIKNDSLTVKAKETAEAYSPRIFGLQKLVEVADYNMHVRHRIDWARMWNTLANHFCVVGCHDSFYIAMYAIDSLKQLSIKFLQKEELSNFNFQRLFLKPFEVIMNKSKSDEIKDIILGCLDMMIRACSTNIRSGWRTIFAIFEVAAAGNKADLAKYAFTITDMLLAKQFELLIYDFVEIMNCLVAFVACPHTNISLAALNHLGTCAKHLVDGDIPVDAVGVGKDGASRIRTDTTDSLCGSGSAVPSVAGAIEGSTAVITEDASVFRLWWPLLLGLAGRIADQRYDVRTRALDTLVSILNQHGHIFSAQAWSVIFKGVLFPIMDSATTDFTPQPESRYPRHYNGPNSSKDSDSWIGTTGLKVITAIMDLFDQFKSRIYCDVTAKTPVTLLPDIVTMLEGCICQDVESLARLGLYGLRYVMRIVLPDGGPSDGDDADSGDEIDKRRRSQSLDLDAYYAANDAAGAATANTASKSGAMSQFYRECAATLCYRVSNIALKNLCLDFQEAGKVGAVSVPINGVVLDQCPVGGRYSDSCNNGNSNPNTTLLNFVSDADNRSNAVVSPNTNDPALSLIKSFDEDEEDDEDEEEEELNGIDTPYGRGEGGVTVAADTHLGIPDRRMVKLTGWTGELYCSVESNRAFEAATEARRAALAAASTAKALARMSTVSGNTPTPTPRPTVSWRKMSAAAMVSTIVTLDVIDLIGDLLYNNFENWSVEHFNVLIYSLTVIHHHARTFNRNKELRMQLKLRHFMEFSDRIDRLPHLLDQEVAAMEQLLLISLRLYRAESESAEGASTETEARRSYIEPIVQR